MATQTGRLQCLRLVALGIFAFFFARRARKRTVEAENALALSALVLALSFAASTHSAAAPMPMVAISFAVLHLVCVATWASTLLTTLIAYRTAGYRDSPEFTSALRAIVKANPKLIAARRGEAIADIDTMRYQEQVLEPVASPQGATSRLWGRWRPLDKGLPATRRRIAGRPPEGPRGRGDRSVPGLAPAGDSHVDVH